MVADHLTVERWGLRVLGVEDDHRMQPAWVLLRAVEDVAVVVAVDVAALHQAGALDVMGVHQADQRIAGHGEVRPVRHLQVRRERTGLVAVPVVADQVGVGVEEKVGHGLGTLGLFVESFARRKRALPKQPLV
jgi:hypothetical protein